MPHPSKLLPFLALLLGAWLPSTLLPAAEPPIRVLILSGQNNHDWKKTTPKLQSILADSGRFEVEVTEHPEQLEPAALANFQLLLSNWNAWGKPSTEWPAPLRAAYLEFLRGGKGLVVVHAGSSSFYDWADYQVVAGACWKLGETSHGAPHDFTVRIADPAHPITQGMAPFRSKDELWLKPGLQPSARVLATAEDQPVALVSSFGRGRSFTLLMGHSAEFMENPGFQALLLRGSQWAATAVVTLPAQPAINPDAVLKAVAAYRFGDPRDAILKLERLVQTASSGPAARKELAAKLLALATAPTASLDGKRQALWLLSLVASQEETGKLRELATDPDLGYYAQNALTRSSGPAPRKSEMEARAAAATAAAEQTKDLEHLIASLIHGNRQEQVRAIAALRAAGNAAALRAVAAQFDKLSGTVQPGVLALLGERPDPATLPVLEKAATAADLPSTRQTAIVALGHAGSASTVPLLIAALATAPDEERKLAAESLSLIPGREADDALIQALTSAAPAVQRELVRVLAVRQAAHSLPALLTAAKSPDAGVRSEAGTAIGRLGDKSHGAALIALLDTSPDVATVALAAICRRENTVQPVLDAMKDAPQSKRSLLIAVLGSTGSSQALDALRSESTSPDPASRSAAIRALASWANGDVFDELVTLAGKPGDPAMHTLVVRGLARLAPQLTNRNPQALAATLATVLANSSATERKSLLGALAKLPSPEALKLAEQYETDSEAGAEARVAAAQIKAAIKGQHSSQKRMGSATAAQMKLFDLPGNLCRGASASSPTGLQPDGHGDVPAAAIDGDGATFWDEINEQSLYRLQIRFAKPSTAGSVRILGFQHHHFAPQTFEILCDGKPVKKVENAQYTDNVLSVDLPPTECRMVELSIAGYYGSSPAIRELGIFAPNP